VSASSAAYSSGIGGESSTFTSITRNSSDPQCMKSGCFEEICSKMTVQMFPCEWKEEYKCYKLSECEYVENIGCKWSHSQRFYDCISEIK
jgi:hypothetical protein